MTEGTKNEQGPKGIQFAESAKWHIAALIEGRILIMDAATRLKFLLENIYQDGGREKFMEDMKDFVLQEVAETLVCDEETAQAKGKELYEAIVEAIQISSEYSETSKELAIELSQRVQQTLAH